MIPILLLTLAALAADPATAADPTFAAPPIFTSCPQGGWTLDSADGGIARYSGVDVKGDYWTILCRDAEVFATTVQWPRMTASEAVAFVVGMSEPSGFGALPVVARTPKITAYGWRTTTDGVALSWVLAVYVKGGARFTATSVSLEDTMIAVKGVK